MRGRRRGGSGPPGGWERLLRLILPPGPVGASILGDLREEHDRRASVDPRAAAGWYRRAAASVALRALAGRLRRRGAHPVSGASPKGVGAMARLRSLLETAAAAVRGVRRAPRISVAIVAILALGLGANVTMFGIVDRLLLSAPDGIRDPGSVRRIFVERPDFRTGEPRALAWMTYPDYAELRGVAAYTQVAAYTAAGERILGHGGEAVPIRVKEASVDFFPLLGVQAVVGRLFTADDAAPGAEPTVVLTERFWRRAFAADAGVLGRSLDIGRGRYTVVGVTPAGFVGADLEPVDAFLELEAAAAIELGDDGDEWRESRNWWWMSALARLAPGVDAPAADAAATAAYRAGRAVDGPSPDRILSTSLVAADVPEAPSELAVTRWLGGVALLVLLIACANVANLLLVRASRRRRELALQRALGLGRGRLLLQVLLESLTLATLGGAAALALAQWGGSAVRATLFPRVDFPPVLASGHTLVFTALGVLTATCLAGLAPAVRAARGDVADALRHGGRSATADHGRTRSIFVAVQAGLTIVLLAGAGLFVRSLREATSVDLGFDPDAVVSATLVMDGELAYEDRVAAYYRALRDVRRLPWVAAASLHTAGPFQGSMQVVVRAEGVDSLPRLPGGGPYAYPVASAYFETMGMEIRLGRGLTEADDHPDAEPVAVVNETMARALWPQGDAVGRCLYIREGPCAPVVGVVGDAAVEQLVGEPAMAYYVPFLQGLQQPPGAVVVRVADARVDVTGSLRATLGAASPEARYVRVERYADELAPKLRSWRLGATLFTAFGLLALIVAAAGLYSTLAYQVADRRRELGIRSALGAPGGRLLGAAITGTLAAAAVGLVAGLALAVAMASGLESLLFGVSPTDPATYAGASALVLALATVAAAEPAWRAVRLDPVEALRTE